MEEEQNKLSLEDKFKLLEEQLAKLEDEDIALEEAFGLYSEGMKLLKECNDEIDRVEKKVLMLKPDGTVDDF